MKVHPAFFRDNATKQLLDRAAAAVAIPMCIHGGADLRVLGWGGCTACAWTNSSAEGREACRASRLAAGGLARRQGIPVTFICHMGFTCVIAPALRDAEFTLVFGPYTPSEADQALEYAVWAGIKSLGLPNDSSESLPFTLKDIRTAPQGSVSATAEWVMDTLNTRYAQYELENPASLEDATQPSQEDDYPLRGVPWSRNEQDTLGNVEAAMAGVCLLCGRPKEARAFLADCLEETANRPEMMQSRLIRALSEMLEAIAGMGCNTEEPWKIFTAFTEEVNGLDNKHAMLKTAEKATRRIASACGDHFRAKAVYMPQVIDSLFNDYREEKLLTQTAARVGVSPSSITRMLEKLTGAKFSEVHGRIRVSHARRLLRETGLSATRVGETVGIKDQSNFTKLFQRYCDCSPADYRKRFSK